MVVDAARFRACVVDALKLPDAQYRPDLKIGDVEQWDSVAHLDLMSEIERAFGVRFDLDEIASLTSLSEIMASLAKQK